MSKRRRTVSWGVAGVVLVAIAGAAYALWSVGARGTGRAQATVAVEAVVSPADGDPDLYPGFTEGDLALRIANPNPYPITFTDMTAGAITSSDEAACPGETWITVEDASGLDLDAPPGDSGTLMVDDVVAMRADAPNGCQNVSFDITITLTGSQTTAP